MSWLTAVDRKCLIAAVSKWFIPADASVLSDIRVFVRYWFSLKPITRIEKTWFTEILKDDDKEHVSTLMLVFSSNCDYCDIIVKYWGRFRSNTCLPLRLEAETTRWVTAVKSLRLRIRTWGGQQVLRVNRSSGGQLGPDHVTSDDNYLIWRQQLSSQGEIQRVHTEGFKERQQWVTETRTTSRFHRDGKCRNIRRVNGRRSGLLLKIVRPGWTCGRRNWDLTNQI